MTSTRLVYRCTRCKLVFPATENAQDEIQDEELCETKGKRKKGVENETGRVFKLLNRPATLRQWSEESMQGA